MNQIFERVSKWNAARYDRVFNFELSFAFLKEEYNEYLDAVAEVDKLDVLCDIIYVSLGILWKFNLEEKELYVAIDQGTELAQALLDVHVEPAYFIATVIVLMQSGTVPTIVAANAIVVLVNTQMEHVMGLSAHQCIQALLVVCDSNDSKSIKRIEAHIKVNSGDKGAYFIAPELRLQEILEVRDVH